jgi:hypothetical protein
VPQKILNLSSTRAMRLALSLFVWAHSAFLPSLLQGSHSKTVVGRASLVVGQTFVAAVL